MRLCNISIVVAEAHGSNQRRIGTMILPVLVAEKIEVESVKRTTLQIITGAQAASEVLIRAGGVGAAVDSPADNSPLSCFIRFRRSVLSASILPARRQRSK